MCVVCSHASIKAMGKDTLRGGLKGNLKVTHVPSAPNDRGQWLASLKEGDTVLLVPRLGHRLPYPKLGTVLRLTAKQIAVGGLPCNFRRDTGERRGKPKKDEGPSFGSIQEPSERDLEIPEVSRVASQVAAVADTLRSRDLYTLELGALYFARDVICACLRGEARWDKDTLNKARRLLGLASERR